MKTLLYFVATSALLGLVSGCSHNTAVSGNSSSETSNGVTACVRNSNGTPAAHATVHLRRSDYVSQPPTLTKTAIVGADALTDNNGRFEISGIDAGSYRIEVSVPSTGSGVGAGVLFDITLDKGDSLDLGVDTLEPFATIQGSIDTTGLSGQRLYIQIYGLERLAEVDAAGNFVVDDIPAGTFSVQMVRSNDTLVAVASGITLAPSERTDVRMLSGWNFSKRLYLNTTLTGANVAENVYGFPLLVRLDSVNFDFSQAQDLGQDIRFAKPDGTPLPYEIEQWDRTNQQAAVWVKMDTVYGNSDHQFSVMSWGAKAGSATLSVSNGAAVFDTANGFAGVWHLGESAPGIGNANIYHDATAHQFHGTDNIVSSQKTGVAGLGQQFDTSTHDNIDLGAQRSFIDGASAVTIDAWVSPACSDSLHIIINHSVYSAIPTETSRFFLAVWQNHVTMGARAADADAAALGMGSIASVELDRWYHIVAIVDYSADSCFLFINGELDNAVRQAFSQSAAATTPSASSIIGAQDNAASGFFDGSLDEVRSQRVRRSSTWIKLSYENQRLDQKLVTIQ